MADPAVVAVCLAGQIIPQVCKDIGQSEVWADVETFAGLSLLDSSVVVVCLISQGIPQAKADLGRWAV